MNEWYRELILASLGLALIVAALVGISVATGMAA